MALDTEAFQLLLGGVFVALYAYRRYNTPQSNRHSTTFFRFNGFFLLYLLISLVAYFCIFIALQLLGDRSADVAPLSPALGEILATLEQTPAPIAAALLLTTMLPNLPGLSRFDEAVLQLMWDLGKIPAYLVHQAELLRRARVTIRPALQEEVTAMAREWGLPADFVNFDPDLSVNYKWCKLCALLLEIKRRKSAAHPRYKRFIESNDNELEHLLLDLKTVSQRLANYHETRAGSSSDQRSQRAYSSLYAANKERLEQLQKALMEFIARMVNHAEVSEGRRDRAYIELGFHDAARVHSDVRPLQILELATVLFGGYFLLALLDNWVREPWLALQTGAASPGQSGRGISLPIFHTLVMVITYNIAVLAALGTNRLYRKQRFVAQPGLAFSTRLSAGFLAAGGWAVTAFILRYIQDTLAGATHSNVLAEMARTWPYALQNFALGFGLTWLLQQPQRDAFLGRVQPDQQRERLRQAMQLSAVMTVVALFTAYLLYHLKTDPRYQQAYVWPMEIVKGVTIGFLVGYFVPHWVRVNRARSPMQRLFNFLRIYGPHIDNETRTLQSGALEQTVVSCGLRVAAADGRLDPIELQVIRDLLYRLDAALEDFSGHRAEELLEHNRRLVSDVGEHPILFCGTHHYSAPHLHQVLRYFVQAVALADGAIAEEETAVIQAIERELSHDPFSPATAVAAGGVTL